MDAVKHAIVVAMRDFTVGDPVDPATAVGPMVSQKQYERVQPTFAKESPKAPTCSSAEKAVPTVSMRGTS